MDETLTIDKTLLRVLFDVATSSLDFGSGMLDDEEVEALRSVAAILGVDPLLATPSNFVCKFKGEHEWAPDPFGAGPPVYMKGRWYCRLCRHISIDQPEGVAAER